MSCFAPRTKRCDREAINDPPHLRSKVENQARTKCQLGQRRTGSLPQAGLRRACGNCTGQTALFLPARGDATIAGMKIAYFDCASGISGDMTIAALVDAGIPLPAMQAGIDSLALPSCRLVQSEVKKKGFRACQIIVEHEPEHVHRHLHHIVEMIEGSSLTASQQSLAKAIFQKIGEAEAHVHGIPIEKVHFHEVGAVDSIADIVAAAIGWDLLGVDHAVASPIPTGTGFVTIAHGRCAIPAPATGELLRGMPLAVSDVNCELTTPTGAAILATLIDRFGPLPEMRIESIGYGAGQRDLEQQPNLLRLLVGQAVDSPAGGEQIWALEANIDDASGELLGHAAELLLRAGALDAFTTAVQMKKGRPGANITVLCRSEQIPALQAILCTETTTLGVRRWPVSRVKLQRREHLVSTPYGEVAGMLALLPDGQTRFAPEYEACRILAAERNLPLRQIFTAAVTAFEQSRQ